MTKESKDLTIAGISKLPALTQKYKDMLVHISETMPAIKKTSSNFYKSHSQFMGVMLDVTAITPVRSVKHTLAEIDRTRMALEEAHLKLQENDIMIKKREKQLEDPDLDPLEREHMEFKLLKLRVQGANMLNSIQGAVRKLSFFTTQYKSILAKLGKEDITEKEYEEEEVKYHIMTCMKQALNAARARGGQIDEGNLIYLFDMGINSAVAQREIYNYLKRENDMMAQGENPSHEMTMLWLEHCAELFKNDSKQFADRRGFQLLDDKSLATVNKDKKEAQE
tara:strand:- start:1740 stop:2579 length:840 start_codon:yes stop_codon:yes gene_type:complete